MARTGDRDEPTVPTGPIDDGEDDRPEVDD